MHKMILCIIEDVNNWDRIVMTAIKDSPVMEKWLREQFNN